MNIVRVEEKLNIASTKTRVAVYDFDFELFFHCRHPTQFHGDEICVLRVGAVLDYDSAYTEYQELGLGLVNSPEEHRLASELSAWYPHLVDLTPRSICVDTFPDAEFIEREFGWPVFIKGSRQTSRHNPETSVVRDPEQYRQVIQAYQHDSILHWQRIAIREFTLLQPVPGQVPGKVKPSMEFRTFWWKGLCVGWGRYWYQVLPYSAPDIQDGLALAEQVANRLKVPFLVVDIAKTADGRWIVIECNDAQESGYVGIDPYLLWRKVLDAMDVSV